jgi:hypothetical protein
MSPEDTAQQLTIECMILIIHSCRCHSTSKLEISPCALPALSMHVLMVPTTPVIHETTVAGQTTARTQPQSTHTTGQQKAPVQCVYACLPACMTAMVLHTLHIG